MLKVLYYDKDLIVCIKPIGISSELTKNKENMLYLIYEYLKNRNIDINYNNIGVIHRLDNAVSGVMVYSLNKSTTSRLSTQMTNKMFNKEYLAIVNGIPKEPNGLMKDLLFKDSRKNKSFIVNKIRKGVKEAILSYNVLSSREIENRPVSLINIKLYTGRTHQIRVQFSSRQMPLLCDKKYGSRFFEGNICLWSYKITFNHPKNNNKLEFQAIPDTNNLYWNYFQDKINNI